MCRRISCKTCGKPDWRGCGAHIDVVLADVPVNQRCQCRQMKSAQRGEQSKGLLARLFGLSGGKP